MVCAIADGAATNAAIRIVQRGLHVKAKHSRVGQVIARREPESRVALREGDEIVVIDRRRPVILEQRAVGDVRDFEMSDFTRVRRIPADYQT